MKLRYLQFPASKQITNHSKNHKHGLTDQPDIDIHRRHEAVELSDSIVLQFKTQKISAYKPLTGTVPVEPRAHKEKADQTAHHLRSSLNRVREDRKPN